MPPRKVKTCSISFDERRMASSLAQSHSANDSLNNFHIRVGASHSYDPSFRFLDLNDPFFDGAGSTSFWGFVSFLGMASFLGLASFFGLDSASSFGRDSWLGLVSFLDLASFLCMVSATFLDLATVSLRIVSIDSSMIRFHCSGVTSCTLSRLCRSKIMSPITVSSLATLLSRVKVTGCSNRDSNPTRIMSHRQSSAVDFGSYPLLLGSKAAGSGDASCVTRMVPTMAGTLQLE